MLSQDFDSRGENLRFDPVELLANDTHGIAILRATGQRDGKPLETLIAYAARFDDDGKQREGWFLVSNREAWDEFYRP